VYSGGVAGTLNKWGVPSFGAGYNSSQGIFYNVGNNPRVYPGQEAALQRQFAAVSAQTQAMIAGERQQQAISEAWYYSIPFIGDFMRAGRDHAQGNYLSMVNNMCWGALWFVPELGGARGTTAAAKTGTTVVGETMDRVIQASSEIPGSKILNTMPQFTGTADQITSQMMQYNRQWILNEMRSGNTILDIGLDINRADRSIFYQMEQNMIKNYQILHPGSLNIVKP
jgi:hypothetical protein